MIEMKKSLEKKLFDLNFTKHDEEVQDITYTVKIPSMEKTREYILAITLDQDKDAVVFSIVGNDFNNDANLIRLAAFGKGVLDRDESVIAYIKRAYDLFKV